MANEITALVVGGITYTITPAWTSITGKPSTFPPSSHTHSYLPLSGGTLTGDLIINAPYRDNYYASNLCRHFYSGTPTEFVIKTKIKYISGTHMPIVRIYGYAYGENSPIELRVGFYIYGGNLGWAGAVSTGAWKPQVFLFKYTENSVEYVAVGFKGACYFCGFQVDAQIGASGSFGTNFSIDGWSTTHNGADTSVSIIPAVGTNNCIQVDYKTMKTDISGNAATATSATKATQDGSGNTITSYYARKSVATGGPSNNTSGGAGGHNHTVSVNTYSANTTSINDVTTLTVDGTTLKIGLTAKTVATGISAGTATATTSTQADHTHTLSSHTHTQN